MQMAAFGIGGGLRGPPSYGKVPSVGTTVGGGIVSMLTSGPGCACSDGLTLRLTGGATTVALGYAYGLL